MPTVNYYRKPNIVMSAHTPAEQAYFDEMERRQEQKKQLAAMLHELNTRDVMRWIDVQAETRHMTIEAAFVLVQHELEAMDCREVAEMVSAMRAGF